MDEHEGTGQNLQVLADRFDRAGTECLCSSYGIHIRADAHFDDSKEVRTRSALENRSSRAHF
jgi:hypothetical protein